MSHYENYLKTKYNYSSKKKAGRAREVKDRRSDITTPDKNDTSSFLRRQDSPIGDEYNQINKISGKINRGLVPRKKRFRLNKFLEDSGNRIDFSQHSQIIGSRCSKEIVDNFYEKIRFKLKVQQQANKDRSSLSINLNK